MKKFLIILFFVSFQLSFGQKLVEIQPDSLNVKLDIVESGYYEVYYKTTKISQHTKKSKADAKAKELTFIYPQEDIKVESPTGKPITNIKVFIDENKLGTPIFKDSTNLTQYNLDKIIVEKHNQLFLSGENLQNVTISLPDDDTGYVVILNPNNKTVIVNGNNYTETYITLIKNNDKWELLDI